MGRAGAWRIGDSRWTRPDGRGRLLLTLQKLIRPYIDDPVNRTDQKISKAHAEIGRDTWLTLFGLIHINELGRRPGNYSGDG